MLGDRRRLAGRLGLTETQVYVGRHAEERTGYSGMKSKQGIIRADIRAHIIAGMSRQATEVEHDYLVKKSLCYRCLNVCI